MEVLGDDYKVWDDQSNQCIYCQGSLRLAGTEEYTPIIKVLDHAIE